MTVNERSLNGSFANGWLSTLFIYSFYSFSKQNAVYADWEVATHALK